MTMESSFQDFKKVALKKKRAVKNQQANAKDFINWLLMQDNVVDGLLHSGLTSEKG